MSYSIEDIERMVEIKDTIKELVEEALQILDRKSISYSRAESYWYPHILMELDSDHQWLGGSMCTMQDTIDEMSEDEEFDEEDED